MTRRILLTLADDTTATECGACPQIGEPRGHWCSIWGAIQIGRKRLPECIAAEAAAVRMVEIAPEDALELCDTMLRHDFDMCLHRYPGAERAGNAIDAHADKAR